VSCSDCTRQDGCEAHKGPQRSNIDASMRTIYPSLTWGAPDDEARFGAGVPPGEVRRLARALSVATRAPTFHRPGGPEDLCEFVYVLCVGREPALVDVRDRQLAPEGDRLRERYLRVAFSTVARVATVQEVAMELDRDGDACVVRELPQPGVYDPQLLKRMRAVVALIEASDLEHLDFGLVDAPYPEAQPGEYLERYGVAPAIVNFLFYAQPARTAVTTFLDASAFGIQQRAQRRVAP
jgi:hypothetical protein